MTETIVAPDARKGDGFFAAGQRAIETREARALRLFYADGDRIEQAGPLLYYCPSQDGERYYHVEYGGQDERCTCPDWQYRGQPCVHLLATAIKQAKGRAKRRKNFMAAFAEA